MADRDPLEGGRGFLQTALGLTSERHIEIWQLIVAVGTVLEDLAVRALWEDDGRRASYSEYRDRMTLGQAATELSQRNLFPPAIVDGLRSIARLRNSVVHRRAVERAPEVAEWNSRKVFENTEALGDFVRESGFLLKGLAAWLDRRDADHHLLRAIARKSFTKRFGKGPTRGQVRWIEHQGWPRFYARADRDRLSFEEADAVLESIVGAIVDESRRGGGGVPEA